MRSRFLGAGTESEAGNTTARKVLWFAIVFRRSETNIGMRSSDMALDGFLGGPAEEEDGDEEGSEGESDEVDDADEDGEQVTQKAPKRRKRRPPDSGRSSLEIDLTNSEPYDEEEAALKRALSLSVRDGTGEWA